LGIIISCNSTRIRKQIQPQETKRTNPNEQIKTGINTNGKWSVGYVNKELLGRRSNPKNILRKYFWITVSGATVKGIKSLPGFF